MDLKGKITKSRLWPVFTQIFSAPYQYLELDYQQSTKFQLLERLHQPKVQSIKWLPVTYFASQRALLTSATDWPYTANKLSNSVTSISSISISHQYGAAVPYCPTVQYCSVWRLTGLPSAVSPADTVRLIRRSYAYVLDVKIVRETGKLKTYLFSRCRGKPFARFNRRELMCSPFWDLSVM